MKGPPVTITCECGATASIPYGERWECPECGRRWDTRQIPAEEYEGLLRRMKRVRFHALAVALALAAVFGPLIVFVSGRFIVLAAFAAFCWIFFYVPFWRRRARRAAASSPRWELHPD